MAQSGIKFSERIKSKTFSPLACVLCLISFVLGHTHNIIIQSDAKSGGRSVFYIFNGSISTESTCRFLKNNLYYNLICSHFIMVSITFIDMLLRHCTLGQWKCIFHFSHFLYVCSCCFWHRFSLIKNKGSKLKNSKKWDNAILNTILRD